MVYLCPAVDSLSGAVLRRRCISKCLPRCAGAPLHRLSTRPPCREIRTSCRLGRLLLVWLHRPDAIADQRSGEQRLRSVPAESVLHPGHFMAEPHDGQRRGIRHARRGRVRARRLCLALEPGQRAGSTRDDAGRMGRAACFRDPGGPDPRRSGRRTFSDPSRDGTFRVADIRHPSGRPSHRRASDEARPGGRWGPRRRAQPASGDGHVAGLAGPNGG